MPVIPEFENDVAAQPTPPVQADPAGFARKGEAMARGFGQLSAQQAEFSQRYIDAKRMANAADIANGAQKQLQGIADTWSRVPDRQKGLAGYDDAVAKLKPQILNSITDPFLKATVEDHFDKADIYHRTNVGTATFNLERSASVGDAVNQLTDLGHQYAQIGRGGVSNPTADAELRRHVVESAEGVITARVQGGLIDGAQGAEMLKTFRAHADYADAYRDIDDNPAAALEKLNDPANYSNMDELTRGRLIARAENKSQSVDALTKGSVAQRFSDNLASIGSTGQPASALSEDEIRTAFPERAPEMIRQLQLAGGVYQATQTTGLTSLQQDQALLDKWSPKGPGFEDQASAQGVLQKALDTKYKALSNDPAAYVLSASPETGALFALAAKDPTQTGAALSALDAAYDKLGMPADRRPLLTHDAAQGLATGLMSAPEQAPAKMQALESQYGTAWPRVWRQLVTDGKLPGAFQAIPTLDNQRDGALIARWVGQVPSGKSGADLLGEKTTNEIKNAVRADPGVQQFISSLSRSGSSVAQTGTVLDAIDSLAFAKSYFDHDPQAAKNAVSSFVSKWDFMPNGGGRVPADRFSDVQTNARSTLDKLALSQIAVPDIFGKRGEPSAEEYLDQVKAAPTWVTSPNADALLLMDPYGRFVRDKKGQFVTVPFDRASASSPNWWQSMLGGAMQPAAGAKQ